jgi:hypothetical protein
MGWGIWPCFAHLLNNPQSIRVLRDAKSQNLATFVSYYALEVADERQATVQAPVGVSYDEPICHS